MKKTPYKIIIILSIIGVFLASYLLYEYFSLPHESLCYINSTVNCEASTRGPLAQTLGIPTGFYGLAGYLVILFAAFKEKKKLLKATALFGLLFCLRITYLEFFTLNVLCPVCLLCQIDMILVFLISVFSLPKTVIST